MKGFGSTKWATDSETRKVQGKKGKNHLTILFPLSLENDYTRILPEDIIVCQNDSIASRLGTNTAKPDVKEEK